MRSVKAVSLTNALIWGAAILALAVVLRGTEQAGSVVLILAGAVGASVVLVGTALRKA